MGWWGQDSEGHSLLPPGDPSEIGVWGDEPADIIDEAIHRIVELFLDEWKRPPTVEEMIAGIKFSTNGLDWKLPNIVKTIEEES